MPKVISVTGASASGKTHWIRDKYGQGGVDGGGGNLITVAINDVVDRSLIIAALASLNANVPLTIFLNVSAHADPSDVNLLLFQLLVCGALRISETGTVFTLPTKTEWTFVIEIPHAVERGEGGRAEVLEIDNEEAVFKVISTVYLLATESHNVPRSSPFDETASLMAVGRILHAYHSGALDELAPEGKELDECTSPEHAMGDLIKVMDELGVFFTEARGDNCAQGIDRSNKQTMAFYLSLLERRFAVFDSFSFTFNVRTDLPRLG
jgi:hypothetical protein